MRSKLRPHKLNSGEAPCRNNFYAGDPLEVPFRKETAHIPLMIGTTFGEFNSFGVMGYDRASITEEQARQAVEHKLGKDLANKAVPLFQKAYPHRSVIDLLGMDFMFRTYTLQYIAQRKKMNSAPIWDYLFDLDGPHVWRPAAASLRRYSLCIPQYGARPLYPRGGCNSPRTLR